MALTVYRFQEIVSNIATAMQASATAALDFTVGSTLRAIAEAVAGVVLWLQAIILQLLTLTRAATSSGTDLDSWMADFSLPRLPASAASGVVTFSRFTPVMQALIPIGAGVQTADGTQKFSVISDETDPAYDSGLGGYVIPANTASLPVPVRAADLGTRGNVQAGSVTQITGGIPYVDTATNPSGFTNGIDAESDAAYRARFVLYLASLSKATKTAVGYAVTSTRQGLTWTITENQDYDGTTNMGYFYAVVDDGSGYPSTDLLTNVANAIDAVRPLGSRFGVFAPAILTANVSMTLTTASGYAHAGVVAAAGAALARFIDGLPLGTSLRYTQLASVAYSVPGVINATSILLGGTTADVVADRRHKVLAGTMTIA